MISRFRNWLNGRGKLETRVSGKERQTITLPDQDLGGGTEKSQSSMGTSSDEAGLQKVFPDPWEGDWNDAVLNWQMWQDENSKRKEQR